MTCQSLLLGTVVGMAIYPLTGTSPIVSRGFHAAGDLIERLGFGLANALGVMPSCSPISLGVHGAWISSVHSLDAFNDVAIARKCVSCQEDFPSSEYLVQLCP
jgi:hypothetical protein